jgi:hypothetical protein
METPPEAFDPADAKQTLAYLRRLHGADLDRVLEWIREGSAPGPGAPDTPVRWMPAGELISRTWRFTRIPHVNGVLRPLVEAHVLLWQDEGVRFDPRCFPHAAPLGLFAPPANSKDG